MKNTINKNTLIPTLKQSRRFGLNNIIKKSLLILALIAIVFSSSGAFAQVPQDATVEPYLYGYEYTDPLTGLLTLTYFIEWNFGGEYGICANDTETNCWKSTLNVIGYWNSSDVRPTARAAQTADRKKIIFCVSGYDLFPDLARQTILAHPWTVTAFFMMGGENNASGETSEIKEYPVIPKNIIKIAKLVSFSKSSKTPDPINIATGEMDVTKVDFAFKSKGPGLALERIYRSQSTFNGMFGYGWRTTFDISLQEFESQDVLIYNSQGVAKYFESNWDGTYFNSQGNFDTLVKNVDNSFTVTNIYGVVTNYSGDGRISSITDRNGNTLTYVYDPQTVDGTYIEDATGRRITLTLDTAGRITQATDPDGNSFQYQYDLAGDLVLVTNPDNKTSSYLYDENHNITEVTNVNGNKFYFEYDQEDRAIMNSQENGLNQVNLVFQANNTTVVTDALGKQTTYVFNELGLELSRTDALTGTVTTTWDEDMNKTSVTDELGNTTTFQYDDKGNLTKVIDADLNESTFTYTDYNLIKTSTDAKGHTTTYNYNAEGNLTSVIDALNKTSTFAYNTTGQLISTTDAKGNTTYFEYDNQGNLTKTTDAEGNITTLNYDVLGNILSTTTPNGDTSTFDYDVLNRVTQTTTPDNTAVTYTYDSLGNRLSLTDNVGSTTSFTYNNGELLVGITDPLNKQTSFVYDNLAQLTSVTDRNNHTINYEYTDVGNLLKVTYPDTSMVDFTYDLAGNLKTITEDLGVTSFNYDTLHRLTDFTDAQGYNVGYEYDELGNVTKLIYPGVGKEVVYTYDELSRLKTVTSWTGDVATYNYDDAGRLISVENFNGTSSTFDFDKASRVKDIKTRKTTNEIISSYKFTLDGNGNRTKAIQNEPLQLNLPSSDTAFTYNTNRNRLLQAGNTTFSYDDEGQLFSKDTATFTFDYEHRLKSISDSGLDYQYTYDAKGTRLSAYRDGVVTKYIYDAAGNLLAEADEQGIITRYYVYGAGLLAAITPADDVYTYHFNGNGNTIAITDENQNIVNSYSYTPFGQISNEVENIENPFKFVGQFGIIHEVGDIYYVRARYLDASVGRFISEDPIGFEGGINLLAYANNNPVHNIDISGHDSLDYAVGISLIAIGAYVTYKFVISFFDKVKDAYIGKDNLDIEDSKEIAEDALIPPYFPKINMKFNNSNIKSKIINIPDANKIYPAQEYSNKATCP